LSQRGSDGLLAEREGGFGEKEIVEGVTRLLVPNVPSPQDGDVFYNPVQSLSRDFSICVYSAMRPRTFCDPLSGTGARGIRIAKEVPEIAVTCADRNERACDSIRGNAHLNDLLVGERAVEGSSIEVVRENANALLSKRCWDAVDIDPFGSPVPFLDLAAQSAGKFLAITATDPAALCGVYPRVSFRKYLSRTVKTEFYHEVGIRVLAGFAVRMAAKYECALRPLVCHSSNHYYRVYFEKKRGASRTDNSLSQVGFLSWCPECTFRSETAGGPPEKCPFCGTGGMKEIGPLYVGPLFDSAVCEEALSQAEKRGFLGAGILLSKIAKEAQLPAFHYDHHALSSYGGFGPEKLERFLSRLRGEGKLAERTHFSETGFRTDADFGTVVRCLRGGNGEE